MSGSNGNEIETEELTPAQWKAMELMLADLSYVQICERLGINQATLYRWRQKLAFKAELNRRLGQCMTRATERLIGLLDTCLETITADVGNPKTAMAIVKGLGQLAGEAPVIGCQDVNHMKAAEERRRIAAERHRARRECDEASLDANAAMDRLLAEEFRSSIAGFEAAAEKKAKENSVLEAARREREKGNGKVQEGH